MLFKVPMPPRGKSGIYSLRFRLKPNGQVPDVQLQLMNAEETGFTPVRAIPINGMVSEKPIASAKKKKSKKKSRRKKRKKSVKKAAADIEEVTEEVPADEPATAGEPNKGELAPPKKRDEKLRKKKDLEAFNAL